MNIETFDDSPIISDQLYVRQKQDVAKMRTSLLACNDTTNGMTARSALQSISAMQVYHQLTRIIKYLEVMDQLENKMYEAIENQISKSDAQSPSTWITLLNIQEQLQKNMIASHKLLEPYLDLKQFLVVDVADNEGDGEDNPSNQLMSPEQRDRLRSKAQTVLTTLKEGG